jgi:hypothetical protein
MSGPLHTGLILLGTVLLSGCGMSFFRWGPCGPSSIWGLIFLLFAWACLGVGCLWVVAGLVRWLINRMSANAPS